MVQEGFKRKLTAILSADAVDYSRLMGQDEEATVRTITAYREVLTTLIQQHNGKVLDSPGDNLLAEFASVVDAVQCAVAVQKEIKARNDELPDDRRMNFRIGINLGDVIEEEARIYGDGVNIAARLEGLAEPGGICISKTAFDHIESKLPYGYEFLGDQTVKNIAKPVGAFRVIMEPRVTVAGKPVDKKPAALQQMPILVGAVAVLMLAVAAGIWQFYLRRTPVEPASVEKMAYPLPDKPSIAVLPFDNLTDDPAQEYFSDGITNDIITDLSRFKNLFVIASNSSFAYKDKPVKVQEVSQELGVRYILEGSVQRASDRVRINAQLIDATTGKHLWAERYDRDAQSLFDIQDEIIKTIVATLAFKVDAVERERVMRKGTENLDAYDYFLRGRHTWFGWTKEANAQARALVEKAIELDPNWAKPYMLLTWVHVNDWRWGWSDDAEKSMQLALKMAQKTNALDPYDYTSHWTLGFVYLWLRRFDQAIAEYERALALNSNDADFLVEMSEAQVYMGRPVEAIAQIKKAMRINPHYPEWHLWDLGWAYYEAGRYEEALATLKKMNNPPSGAHRTLAAVYVRLGRLDEARAEISELLKKNPDYTIETAKLFPYKDAAQLDRYVNDLRKAGLK
jgi:TolB-like protein/class 3 adenylate cyclase/Tfp pilus assembly protein PilF